MYISLCARCDFIENEYKLSDFFLVHRMSDCHNKIKEYE